MEEVEAPSFHDVLATRAGRAFDPGMELCNLRVVQPLPRVERRLPGPLRRRLHRGLLGSCVAGCLVTWVVLGDRMARPLCITLKVHRAKIRVSMPVEAARGCRVVMMLLLTLLGV